MPLDPSVIGRTSEIRTHTVEAGRIRAFAQAIGESNPIYFSEQAAKAAGHADIPAPPTMFTAFPGGDVRQGLDMDWSRILHGSEEVAYERPLLAGDELFVTTRIKNVFEKTGRSGSMDFLVLETRALAADDSLIFTVIRTVIVKRESP